MNDEYDYRLDVPSVERIDEIPETKIFVAHSSLTEKDAKQLFEKEKIEIFKGLFKRPKDSEVEVKEVKRGLEPYMVIGGRYELRYLTEKTYDIDLNDNAVSVFILGEEMLVQKEDESQSETEVEIKSEKKKGFFDGLFGGSKKKPASKPELQLNGVEHVFIETEITEARNYKGLSINPDSLDEADFTEVGPEYLQNEASIIPADFVDIDNLVEEIITEYAVRPEDAQRILFEKLSITDKKIIFYPIFWVEMIYKGSKSKNVRLDCVSKKVEAPKGTRYAPPPTGSSDSMVVEDTDIHPEPSKSDKLHCPGCGEELKEEATFCPHCGVKLS
ncbi:MAG: zinc ribbon domain-containing protein [Candidatus Thorarchaeota archaeon]